MVGERVGRVPFEAHVELLEQFLANRRDIVERIQDLLNAQRKPIAYLQDRPGLSRLFEGCFYAVAGLSDEQARLRGRLEAAHWEAGFRPRQVSGLYNDLVHPAEMMIRAFHLWQQTRWPGRNGRVRYAETLFNLYVLRCLEHLSLCIWDSAGRGASARLSRIQGVLDALWRSAPADQPVILRDARWLIPLAQSPTTDDLAAYFAVAERVREALSEADRTEVHKAAVQMIGGHLRSQIRHYCINEDVAFDADSVVLRTRTSNALDFALLIQGLAPLLRVYAEARDRGDARGRLVLASAICQGVSADPEMFLNRIDLLGAYSMIEDVFLASDRDGTVAYTPMGRQHLRLLARYGAEIRGVSQALLEDCASFRPVAGTYSPYGAIYGTPSNLTELMAFKTLQPPMAIEFSLEDAFADGDAETLAWADGWRKLPNVDPDVQRLFDYPQQFAEDIFARIERALRSSLTDAGPTAEHRTGRLVILTDADGGGGSEATQTSDLPIRYVRSSDRQLVAAGKAVTCDQTQLLRDRLEGHFVLSVATDEGWVALSKDLLTEVLGAGHDAKISGLPSEAARVLQLMCPNLVRIEGIHGDQASVPPSMLKA